MLLLLCLLVLAGPTHDVSSLAKKRGGAAARQSSPEFQTCAPAIDGQVPVETLPPAQCTLKCEAGDNTGKNDDNNDINVYSNSDQT